MKPEDLFHYGLKIQSKAIGCCAGGHKMREYFLHSKIAFHVVKKIIEKQNMYVL